VSFVLVLLFACSLFLFFVWYFLWLRIVLVVPCVVLFCVLCSWSCYSSIVLGCCVGVLLCSLSLILVLFVFFVFMFDVYWLFLVFVPERLVVVDIVLCYWSVTRSLMLFLLFVCCSWCALGFLFILLWLVCVLWFCFIKFAPCPLLLCCSLMLCVFVVLCSGGLVVYVFLFVFSKFDVVLVLVLLFKPKTVFKLHKTSNFV